MYVNLIGSSKPASDAAGAEQSTTIARYAGAATAGELLRCGRIWRGSRPPQQLKTLRTYLGRVIRDIGCKIEGNVGLKAAFAQLLMLARRVREQQPRQRGPKVYSLHAPEVECIGKGKPHRPYAFGVKVSVATTIAHARVASSLPM